jgi:hypothetical protein
MPPQLTLTGATAAVSNVPRMLDDARCRRAAVRTFQVEQPVPITMPIGMLLASSLPCLSGFRFSDPFSCTPVAQCVSPCTYG